VTIRAHLAVRKQGRWRTCFAAVEVIPHIEQTDSIEIPESEF
jgi:protein subunit release factor B